MHKNKGILSLFSGALGLDLGLEKAGFELLAAVDNDKFVIETIKNNRALLKGKDPIIYHKTLNLENIKQICKDILQKIKDKNRIPLILAGAPPCQPFSTAGKRMSMLDYRSLGIFTFLDAVCIIRPEFFIIENVKGIISAAQKHRPLSQRGPGFPSLSPEEEHGSAFFKILQDLENLAKKQKYCISWGIMNSADYGCPQNRERLIIIGSKNGHYIWPPTTHVNSNPNGKCKWITLKEALFGLKDNNPFYENFSEKTKRFLKKIPEGKNWKSLPIHMHKEAIGGAFNSWGGRSGFLRRLDWDKPSPTITSSPTSRATMLCHPTENRPLSIKECSRIQQFPDGWIFSGFIPQQYKQIGNATPISIGFAIGREIKKACQLENPGCYKGKLICADSALLERMIKRPATKLNPPSMRENKDPIEAQKWLQSGSTKRHYFKGFCSINNLLSANGKAFKEISK